MAIGGNKYPFIYEYIGTAPTYKGVYALYDNATTIYIGKADGEGGVRERLHAHKRGDEGPCTRNATDYRREPADNPSAREKVLLAEYMRANGRLPQCNDVMP